MTPSGIEAATFLLVAQCLPTPSDFNLTILRNKLASEITNYNLKTTHSRPACRRGRNTDYI